MTFNRAYGPARTSAPARSAILTGKYPHNTLMFANKPPFGSWATFFEAGNEEHTIAVYLEGSGYNTALIGKYMPGYVLEPYHVPRGWSYWVGATTLEQYDGYGYELNENGTLVLYDFNPEDYITDVIRQKVNSLRSTGRDPR